MAESEEELKRLLMKAKEDSEKPGLKLNIEKTREFQKNIYFSLLTISKSLTVWITTKYGKFLKRWEYQTTLPASRKICMQVKKQQLEPDME